MASCAHWLSQVVLQQKSSRAQIAPTHGSHAGVGGVLPEASQTLVQPDEPPQAVLPTPASGVPLGFGTHSPPEQRAEQQSALEVQVKPRSWQVDEPASIGTVWQNPPPPMPSGWQVIPEPHAWHARPKSPHAELLRPDWQTPFRQQPEGQLELLQLGTPQNPLVHTFEQHSSAMMQLAPSLFLVQPASAFSGAQNPLTQFFEQHSLLSTQADSMALQLPASDSAQWPVPSQFPLQHSAGTRQATPTDLQEPPSWGAGWQAPSTQMLPDGQVTQAFPFVPQAPAVFPVLHWPNVSTHPVVQLPVQIPSWQVELLPEQT